MTLSQTSTSYTSNSDNTLLMLNVVTKLPLILNDYQLRNSKLEAKFMSRLNSSVQHDPPRNYLINSLDHMKSLHFLAPIQSLSDFQTVSTLFTWFSINPIPDCVQPPPTPIIVDDELEFEISKILDSKIDNQCHACKLLYLVHWTGYEGTDEETSWILASKLGHASELVVDFHSAYAVKSGPLSNL